jgi:hypothetical protein
MVVAINFASNRRLGLVDTCQRGPEANTTVGRMGEGSVAGIPTISETLHSTIYRTKKTLHNIPDTKALHNILHKNALHSTI